MELSDRCIHLCKHITTLTEVHTCLLDIRNKSFLLPPFQTKCMCEEMNCNASVTHLYGAYEAERWDGKYIYYCPRGLVFIATPPHIDGAAMEYCIIIGPFIMTNNTEYLFEDPLHNVCALKDIPCLTTAQARSLSEIAAAAVSSLSFDDCAPDVDSGRHADMLQMMYDLSSDSHRKDYPIDVERQLQELIRIGDKEASQKLLNELLVHIYSYSGSDLSHIKLYIRDLLVLMSRAAIDGGADVDEIFNLCYRYESEVNSFTGLEELNRWISAILHKFISFVFDFNSIKHQNVIFKTTAYIKEHLTEKLTLDQAAAQVYLSKSYFCRIIKDELGCTFTEYVNRLRIERSKVLLRSTSVPIAEIACAVGFDDQSYFTRIFKKQTGTAPGKYREQRSQKER